MRLLTVLTALIALASAIPLGKSKINPNGVNQAGVDAPDVSKHGNNITYATPLVGLSDADGEVMIAGSKDGGGGKKPPKPDLSGYIVGLFEKTNFAGDVAYGIEPRGMTDKPDKDLCTFVSSGEISSMKFFKNNFNHRAVACYIYADDSCASDDKNWIGDDITSLGKYGFENRIKSIDCYWKGDESITWKSDARTKGNIANVGYDTITTARDLSPDEGLGIWDPSQYDTWHHHHPPRGEVAAPAEAPDVGIPAPSTNVSEEAQGPDYCLGVFKEKKFKGEWWYAAQEHMDANLCLILPDDASISSIRKRKCGAWCAVYSRSAGGCNLDTHEFMRITRDFPTLWSEADGRTKWIQCFSEPWSPEKHGHGLNTREV
ncbi:hypothetical protein CC80DRAFT_489148, partial [Byssothecium circinans]